VYAGKAFEAYLEMWRKAAKYYAVGCKLRRKLEAVPTHSRDLRVLHKLMKGVNQKF
jgi:hypothetical protein